MIIYSSKENNNMIKMKEIPVLASGKRKYITNRIEDLANSLIREVSNENFICNNSIWNY